MHLDLDSAWPAGLGDLARLNLQAWGPKLRFTAQRGDMESFARNVLRTLDAAPFVVFGSGDFHHLSALWVRRFLQAPTVLVSFDNHPDWDMRPPHWCCGGWINRALEISPNLVRASVWGLGNYEYWWPARFFANHRALQSGRLEVFAWDDPKRGWMQRRLRPSTISPESWRERFSIFARTTAAKRAYVTVDMDCLISADATTNWESGKFSSEDVAWALRELRQAGVQIVGGDLCGAWSEPRSARRKQAFAAWMDHPRLPVATREEARAKNVAAFATIWPALCGG